MITTTHPIPSIAADSARAPASRSLDLCEARSLRDALAVLLRKEQSAMADFLVALADFDRCRGWEVLGHASLFAFLLVELRLSRSAAFYRKSAADLLQDFPEVIEPLRDGKLCLSSIAELAKVLTEQNRAVVTPRFFCLSAREAQELVAELQPRQTPATRVVVTSFPPLSTPSSLEATEPRPLFSLAPAKTSHPDEVPLSRVLTSELANGEAPVHSLRATTSSRSPPTCAGSTSRSVGSSCGTWTWPGTASRTPSRTPPPSRCSRQRSGSCWRSRRRCVAR